MRIYPVVEYSRHTGELEPLLTFALDCTTDITGEGVWLLYMPDRSDGKRFGVFHGNGRKAKDAWHGANLFVTLREALIVYDWLLSKRM